MCEHKDFRGDIKVARLTSEGSTAITGFFADIRINCAECGQPFEFVGIPGGFSFYEPRLSVDSTELRAPIKPATGQLIIESKSNLN